MANQQGDKFIILYCNAYTQAKYKSCPGRVGCAGLIFDHRPRPSLVQWEGSCLPESGTSLYYFPQLHLSAHRAATESQSARKQTRNWGMIPDRLTLNVRLRYDRRWTAIAKINPLTFTFRVFHVSQFLQNIINQKNKFVLLNSVYGNDIELSSLPGLKSLQPLIFKRNHKTSFSVIFFKYYLLKFLYKPYTKTKVSWSHSNK